ncbi:ComE operon protein 1 [subsurface metagenome]
MITSKFSQYWTLITILLVAIIAISSIVLWSRYSRSQPIEISMPTARELQGEIYIGGAVSNPGFYSLKAGDTVEALIQAAGGTTDRADLGWLKLYIPQTEEGEQPQKIDLNRAEVWLLEALPGIGETRAQAIIDYRQQNGPFNNIKELTKVEGIGTATYEKIKHLITVAD